MNSAGENYCRFWRSPRAGSRRIRRGPPSRPTSLPQTLTLMRDRIPSRGRSWPTTRLGLSPPLMPWAGREALRPPLRSHRGRAYLPLHQLLPGLIAEVGGLRAHRHPPGFLANARPTCYSFQYLPGPSTAQGPQLHRTGCLRRTCHPGPGARSPACWPWRPPTPQAACVRRQPRPQISVSHPDGDCSGLPWASQPLPHRSGDEPRMRAALPSGRDPRRRAPTRARLRSSAGSHAPPPAHWGSPTYTRAVHTASTFRSRALNDPVHNAVLAQ
jgi:hypothetical protein